MASIEQQIRDAVPQQLARAAQFDDKGYLPMAEWAERDGTMPCLVNLTGRAERNIHRAWGAAFNATAPNDEFPLEAEKARTNLLDCMNLCALALSLLPSEALDDR
jgi:hypothetical protein